MSTTYGLKNFDQVSYEYESANNRWIVSYPANSGASIWSNDKHYTIAMTHGVYVDSTLIGTEFQQDITVAENAEEILYGFGRTPYSSPYNFSASLPFNKTVKGTFAYWKSNTTSLTTFPDGFTKLGEDTWTIITPKEVSKPTLTAVLEGDKVKVSVSGGLAPTNEKGITYKWNFYTYQISINDGPWEQWKNSTSSTEYLTDLAPGSTYKFRAQSRVLVSNIPFTWTSGSKTFDVLSYATSDEVSVKTTGTRPIYSTFTFKDTYKWKFTAYPTHESGTEQSYRIYGTMEAQSGWGSWNQTTGALQMVEFVREDGNQTSELFRKANALYTYALYETNQSQKGTEFYLNSTKMPPNGDRGWQNLGIVTFPKDKTERKWSLHFIMDALGADITISDVLTIDAADVPPELDDIIDIISTQNSITATFKIANWGSSKVNTYFARALLFDNVNFASTFYYKNETLKGLEPESFTYTFTNNSQRNGNPKEILPNQRFYLTFEATRADMTNNTREIVKEVYTRPKNSIEFSQGNALPTYNTASVLWNRDSSLPQALLETKQIWYKADDEATWTKAYDGTGNSGTLNLTNLRSGRRYEFRSTVKTDVGSETINHGYLFKTATAPSNPKDLKLYWYRDLTRPVATFRSVTTSNDKRTSFAQNLSNGRAGAMLARRLSDNSFQVEASIIATGKESSITSSAQAIGLKMIPDDEQMLAAFNNEYNKAYTEITWSKPTDCYLDNFNHTGSLKKMYNVNLFRIPYTETFTNNGVTWKFNAEDQTITLNGKMTAQTTYPIRKNDKGRTDISENHNWMQKVGPYISQNDWYTTVLHYNSGTVTRDNTVTSAVLVNRLLRFDGEGVGQILSPDIKAEPQITNADAWASNQNTSTQTVGAISWHGIWTNSATGGLTFNNYKFRLASYVTTSKITGRTAWQEPERFGAVLYSGNDYAGYYHVDNNEFSATAPSIAISIKRKATLGGEPEITDFKEILTEQVASMQDNSWQEFDDAEKSAELIDDLTIYSHRALKLTIKDKNALEVYSSSVLDYAADFIPGHQYYVAFMAKSNQDTTLETFWPAEAGHSTTYTISGDNKWTLINATFTAETSSSTDFRFRFDNNQSTPAHDNQIVQIAMPILIDLSLPLGVGKEPPIKWCETNLTYDLFYPNPSEAQLLNENDTQEKEPDYTYFIGDDATKPYDQPVYAEKVTSIPANPQDGVIYFITDSETESRKEIEFKELFTEDEFNQIAPQPNKIYYITENE